jgi:hypothetical protein
MMRPTRYVPLLALLLLSACALGAELKPAASQAFDQYSKAIERRIEGQFAGNQFLWIDTQRQRDAFYARLRRGELVIESALAPKTKVPDGLIHHWIGTVFVPGVTLKETLAMIQDYANHDKIYAPEIIASKLLSREGNRFHVFYRMSKKKVITVVLNTEHDARFFPVDETRVHSRSYSTRIAEVEDSSRPDGPEKPPGTGHGFLWRLNSWWRFQEKDGGVYVECESASLTRSIPTGFGWLIRPFVSELPKEALTATLNSTRKGLSR